MASKLAIQKLRQLKPAILSLGSHSGIIQSILDFDYLQGCSQPSILAIIAAGRSSERYFFGGKEVVLPVYESLNDLPANLCDQINLALVLVSGRRVLSAVQMAIDTLPNLVGVTIFAERLPERHAQELIRLTNEKSVWVIGGSSVGLMVGGHLKLGAIGGTEAVQLQTSNLFATGQVAVISTSGGMVNEIIRMLANAGPGVSFAVAIGGERFPVFGPGEAFLAAEQDPDTKAIAYFGELGGGDEYELAEMLKRGEITKPVLAYVAGTVAELFETPPQFGHAKAMAQSDRESATAKRAALRTAGAQAAASFDEFAQSLASTGLEATPRVKKNLAALSGRRSALITSSVSYDKDGDIKVLGQDLLAVAENNSFAQIVMSMLLGKVPVSLETENFVDFALRLLVDHGPYVSGAMNTIVTARAGRDLVSSLASGLLTIGPRFGGAINGAAQVWITGVGQNYEPAALVESYASKKQYIPGIGHRKYRSDNPDPRVKKIISLVDGLEKRQFITFAQAVEAETIQKKGNLILNVDGAIAACLLDLLYEKEGYDMARLQKLVDVEFFNALFVLSRSVGFMAHYFDQRRIDEGLFRLPDDQVLAIEPDLAE